MTAKTGRRRDRDYTRGAIPSQMVRFAVPHMLSSALQIAYSAVDLSIVGKAVSGAALSAVSISSQVLNLLTMLGLGFATGTQVYMAQLVGAGKKDQVNEVMGTILAVMPALALGLAAVVVMLHKSILGALHTPGEAYEMAVQYLLFGCVGLAFSFLYNGIASVMRAFGDSQTPFFAIMVSSVVNLALDILFVVVCRWGVLGAVVATVIGQAVSALILVGVMKRHGERYGAELRLQHLRPRRKTFQTIALLALPYALEMVVFNVSMLFVSSMVNSVGLHASEAFGVGLKLEEIGNKICTGITCATSVMVGQNMAVGNIARTQKIVRTAWIFGGGIYLLFAAVCFSVPEGLFSLFIDDAEAIAIAPMFISALSWGFPAMASMRGTNGLMQGVGNARLSLTIGVIDGFLVRIPLCYVLGVVLGKGLYGFFLAYSVAAYTNAGLGMAYYWSGRWKTRKLAAAD